jgi:hypothetical protein
MPKPGQTKKAVVFQGGTSKYTAEYKAGGVTQTVSKMCGTVSGERHVRV